MLPAGRSRTGLVLLLGMTVLLASSCLVVSLNRFADDASIAFEPRLLGTWRDVDDDVSVTIERSEWQSYRLSYTHPIAAGQLTGYLFRTATATYMDLMPVRGEDPGVFTIAAHVLVRLTVDDAQLTVAPLSYDRMLRAADARTAPPELGLVKDERDQLVATADAATMHRWVEAQTTDAAFGPPATFRRQP